MSSKIIEKTISTKYHKNYKVVVETYNSAREVADDCRSRKLTDSRFHDYTTYDLDDWHGVKTYEEALDLLANGYQPTVEKMREALKASANGVAKRITMKNDIVGFSPVVPLALLGVPQNMINMTMKPIKAKVIDVYYDMTCNCGTTPEQIIKAGQAVLGAIVDLERQGYKFNLYGVQSYTDGKTADVLAVKIKSSNQPLDLKRISFPLTHTAFFRVIGFDWYSRCPKATYRGGYGCAAYFNFEGEGGKELEEFGKAVFGQNVLYISAKKVIDKGDRRQNYLKEVLTDVGNRTNNADKN